MIAKLFHILRGSWARRRVRPVFRLICEAATHVVPPRRHCAVFAWPDREGNGVEVLRYLADHYPGRIYWLRSDLASDLSWLFEPHQLERIEPVSRTTLRGLVSFLLAEAAFFTHGAFDRPRFGSKRTFVNLWHGDGPKSFVDPRPDMPSSVVVAGTDLFGKSRAEHWEVPEAALLVTGNPRIDQFERPASDSRLAALGLDPLSPIVCWAPTYRASSGDTALAWTDGEPLSAADAVAQIEGVANAAGSRSLQLIVKPHPLDVDRYVALGIRVVTDRELDEAQVSLYQLLARSAALITDYSSIWTDFLVLDRPIALYCPDLSRYVATRGLGGLDVADYRAIAPGPFLADTADFAAFFDAIQAGVDPSESQRHASARAIGAVVDTGATERLMTRLRDWGFVATSPTTNANGAGR